MIRIGILGMGGMGWIHATRIAGTANAKLVAIADSDPERLRADQALTINVFGRPEPLDLSDVMRYSSASQLIAEAPVDAIHVCLPTHWHAQFTIEALEHGLHVLCEKPMALTVGDADQMIEGARGSGRVLMIAQCVRFWPEYCFLRDCIADGRYGRLISLNMRRLGQRPEGDAKNWFLDPECSGGMILDLHIHDVDFVHHVLGRPDSIHATDRAYPGSGAPDVIHAEFLYQGGPQVHLHAGWSAVHIPFDAGYDAWFERAFVRLDTKLDPSLRVYDRSGNDAWAPTEYVQGDAYANEISYFVQCIVGGMSPSECSPQSTRDSLALVFREIDSARTGERLED
ncbi:MAG: Gfo/Idh/MocA family oxidoreductase [Chloroflexi bacterium]|nr:Gfo/Idh/MocA family oxidoreductase [Chloroflexota bacterium]